MQEMRKSDDGRRTGSLGCGEEIVLVGKPSRVQGGGKELGRILSGQRMTSKAYHFQGLIVVYYALLIPLVHSTALLSFSLIPIVYYSYA